MVDEFAVLGPGVEAVDRVDDRADAAASLLGRQLVDQALDIAAADVSETVGAEVRLDVELQGSSMSRIAEGL